MTRPVMHHLVAPGVTACGMSVYWDNEDITYRSEDGHVVRVCNYRPAANCPLCDPQDSTAGDDLSSQPIPASPSRAPVVENKETSDGR